MQVWTSGKSRPHRDSIPDGPARSSFAKPTELPGTQLENVESFNYLGSMLTNDGRCTCEIKARIPIAKAAFNKERGSFY